MIMVVFASCNTPSTDSGDTENPTASETDSGAESDSAQDSEPEKDSKPAETDGKGTSDESDPVEDTDSDNESEEKDTDESDAESGTTGDESEIDYGTLANPVTTTYAYTVCSALAQGESSLNPFYIKGTITRIGETGNYYKNVYFTDGSTEMLIYTLNMGEGISSVKVGDTITAFGYVKNYEGTIEMATGPNQTYVYVVDVENNGGSGSGSTETPDANHTYTDFTSSEKSLFNSIVGLVIPFIPNDEYYVEEKEDEYGKYISYYTLGNTEAEFNAYRALFSSYSYDGSENDEYGDAWYYYSKGNVCVEMSFYYYDGEYVVDIYAYTATDGSGSGDQGSGDVGSGDVGGGTTDGEPEINYGTLANPVTTTYAYTVCSALAQGESSLNPFYIKGTITRIGETGNYYKNVYFTDGSTEMLIYTLNMSNGISGV